MARYFAFISYSHDDAVAARWLHRALETYRIPRALRGLPGSGTLPDRLAPVFLDRAELATSAELTAEIQRALEDSENLIVVCSPAAARSRWVNEEIRRFCALGRHGRLFCVVVAGEGDGVVFPPALREPLVGADEASRPVEPLAADLRPEADGRRDGLLKLVAGLLGLRFDQLRRREQARRQRRLLAITTASVAISVALAGLSAFALFARREAEQQRSIAEQRSLTAERTTAFLQSLFEISDPSEARGETITAREMLDRGAKQIDTGLSDEPDVRATLIATLGSVYASLGLHRQADEVLGRAQTALPPGAGASAKLSIALGELRLLEGEYPAANDEFRKALEGLGALGGEADPERARALIAFGESLASTDEFDAAREKISQGIAAAQRARPEATALVARGVEAQGLAALYAGELDAAEVAYRQALAMRLAESGENHPKVSDDLNSLGSVEYLRGNRDRAAEYFARVLEIDRRVLSPEHPAIAGILNNLARINLEQRKFAEAREHLRHARDLMLAENSATHDDMAFVFNNLALAEAGLGNDPEALTNFAAAWRAAEPHRHRMRGPILTDLADLDCRAHRYAEAVQRLEQAQPFLAEDYPDDPWRQAWLGLVRASCALSAGDLAAANTALAANLPIVLARWPDDTLYGLSALRRAVAIRERAGDDTETAKLRQRIAQVAGAEAD